MKESGVVAPEPICKQCIEVGKNALIVLNSSCRQVLSNEVYEVRKERRQMIWFLVSYGCGILFVDALNQIRIPGTGFKLGFWFAQQGSIYVFVVLIFVYVWRMNRLDREHGVQED